MKRLVIWVAALLLAITSTAQDKIVLRLMGDSTMADKDLSYENPERGWGQCLKAHVDTNVVIANYAQNGRSTKSVQTLGIWDRVKKDLKKGEYLFIQFGHNDSKESDTTRYAAAFGAYQDNIRLFVDYALSVGAKPVLFTPVSRRWFDKEGNLKRNCHGDYPAAVTQVAKEYGLPIIDANTITQDWLISLGDEATRKYYMWVEKGTNPKHPEGKVDNTHTTAAGARKICRLLIPEIVKIIPGLEAHLIDFDFVVAKDGTGDFFTVQEAINAAPDYCKQDETIIYIKDGVYEEKVTIPTSKQKLHIIGQSAENTVIRWSDYAKKIGPTGYEMGTSATSTVFLYGSDFLAENLTIENAAGEGKNIGQACAITVDADRVAFINCRFIANQDTIYTYGKGQRQYFRNCWIEGTTDFIFGASTCWFEDCTILSKKNSYITAASTPEGEEFGYVFNRCHLIASSPDLEVYLGRPWRSYAKTVFLNCIMDGHIRKEGWHNWNKPYAEKTAFYAEYGSTGAGAEGERVKWSYKLKEKEVRKYTPSNVLKCGLEEDKNGNGIRAEWYFKVF